jgi:hypothetical protein
LPTALWRLLRKHSLIRTGDEERRILFTQSEKVPLRDYFSFNIFRALRACMLLSPLLEDVQLQFVTGANTSIDLIYIHHQKSIQIHQKWLNFEQSHANDTCDAYSMRPSGYRETDLFSCDHIVEDLFEMLVCSIRPTLSPRQMPIMNLRRKARELIHRMPRMVRLSKTTVSNQLKVGWMGNESSSISKTYANKIQYVIILHRMSTCSRRGGQLCHQVSMCNPKHTLYSMMEYLLK